MCLGTEKRCDNIWLVVKDQAKFTEFVIKQIFKETDCSL